MTDVNLLAKAIERSGYRERFIAEKLGLSYQGYLNKKRGESEFRQSEIETLCDLLKLSAEEKEAIFFARTVD